MYAKKPHGGIHFIILKSSALFCTDAFLQSGKVTNGVPLWQEISLDRGIHSARVNIKISGGINSALQLSPRFSREGEMPMYAKKPHGGIHFIILKSSALFCTDAFLQSGKVTNGVPLWQEISLDRGIHSARVNIKISGGINSALQLSPHFSREGEMPMYAKKPQWWNLTVVDGHFCTLYSLMPMDFTAAIPLRVLCALCLLSNANASESPAVVMSCSFEAAESKIWSVLRQYADLVSTSSSQFQGSNFDGVEGAKFLVFGMGSNRGKIRFEVVTVPGRTYTLTYSCGATDTELHPPRQLAVGFTSLVQAYHGKKTVIDHYGYPVEVDDVENLGSRLHSFSVPGVANWKIYGWEAAGYSFTATTALTRIEFDTPTTTGSASVGVLDQVLVTTEPYVDIRRAGTGLEVDFAGKLQESTNLMNWNTVTPKPASPFTMVPTVGMRFFRVEK